MNNCNKKITTKLYTIPSPSVIFLLIIFLVNLLPSLYIFITEYNEDFYGTTNPNLYYQANQLNFTSATTFFIIFLFTRILTGKIIISKRIDINTIVQSDLRINKLIEKIALISIIFTFIYIVSGGYEKILNYGSSLDSWEYRMIGYDDRSRILTVFLELSRRVFFPFVGMFYLLKLYNPNIPKKQKIQSAMVLAAYFVGAISTLDRGPILLFILLFLTPKLLSKKTSIIPFLISATFIIILIGGLFTFIQYNLPIEDIFSIFATGFDFFTHRAILIPSITPIELSFYLFPENSPKLYLQGSRLSALFGGDYIGSQEESSILVTPVGMIGDIWRNFGHAGLLIFPILFSMIFKYLDKIFKNIHPSCILPFTFVTLNIGYYLSFGQLFSQGVFASFLFLFTTGIIFKKSNRKL